MMTSPAGKRDRKIKIERFTTAADGSGELIKTWAELATVWAAKTDVSDGERFRAAEVAATISTRFRVLYSADLADVNPKDRIEYPVGSGVYFDIFSVKEIGRREAIEITAMARTDGGQ